MRRRAIQFFSILFIILFTSSCSNFQEFPVSDKAPGAEIQVAITQDKYDNNVIKIRTKYLVAPERLNPAKSFYVVWVETDDHGVFNVGKLDAQTSTKSNLRTLTPFNPIAVFITAEDEPLLTVPKGVEICRADVSGTKEMSKK